MESRSYYTLAMWRVLPGREEEFIAAWSQLSTVFAQLPYPPQHGTLVRNVADPTLFYSFGPWSSQQDIEAMRQDPAAQEAFRTIMALCSEATPATYEVVLHIEL